MKKFLPKITSKIKSFISFKKANPHIYWARMLYLFFAATTMLIIFSFYIFLEIKNKQIFQITSDTETPQNLINEKLLDKVNESFDNKAAKQKEIKDGLTIYKDPSSN
jgi:hypothetical protein